MPTNGFTQGRYKLVYTDTPAKWYDDELNEFGAADFSTSLGFTVGAPKGGRAGDGQKCELGQPDL